MIVTCSLYARRLPRRLSLPDAVEEEELGSVGGAIHGVEVDARPKLQHRLAAPARSDGLQWLEIGDRHDIREVRLLHHGLHEAHALRVVILAGLAQQDDIDTAQSRRRSPLDPPVRACALLPQHTMNGINLHVLDTIHFGQLALEGMHKLASGADNQHSQGSKDAADCNLKQYR